MYREIKGEEVLDFIQNRLQSDLPGSEAHFKMAPMARVTNKSRFAPNEKTRNGGVLILLYPEGNKLYFPLILRPEDTGVHSGQVALPGGKRDEEDQDIIHTALREAWEEVGVDVQRAQVLGQLSEIYIPPSNFLVSPTIAAIKERPVFNPSIHEVAQLILVDLEEFRYNNGKQMKEVTARYMKSTVPCYELNGHTVWGATAMILSEFLSILEEIDFKLA
ncbi:MAG: CoA pyrophosphatase [Bacteroidota bacterium]